MRDGGDAVRALVDESLLESHERERTERRVDRDGAERARELPEPARHERVEVDVARELVLVRRDVAAVAVGADPDADELGGLLLQRHPRDEGLDGVAGGCCREAGGGVGVVLSLSKGHRISPSRRP